MRKLILILVIGLMMIGVVSANTIESSTMYFQGTLTDQGGGVYTGIIPATAGTYYMSGGIGCVNDKTPDGKACIGGFDVYAKEGATAYVLNYYGPTTDEYLVNSNHDAYPIQGEGGLAPWGDWWSPDVADWNQYSLELTANHWYLRYTATQESPMSGTMDWNNLFAAETDKGTEDLEDDGIGPYTIYEAGGPQMWDWNAGDQVERIPLDLAGFQVGITGPDGEGKYKVTLTPYSPNVVYVDDNGICDGYLPCYTKIQEGINAVASGGTVNVAAGTYTENVNVGKSLTLKGASSATVTVNATSPSVSVFTVTANNVDISGFTITGANIATTAGIYLGNDVTLCNIHNNILIGNGDGVWLGSGSNHNTLTGNTLSNNYQGFEVYHSDYNTFTNNIADLNNVYGFKMESASHNTLTNNTANSNAKYGFYLVVGPAIGSTGCNDNTFTNNIANSNTEYGIRINSGSDNTLTGNTFDSNLVAGLRLKDDIINLGMNNNIISNSPLGIDIATGVGDVSTWTLSKNKIIGNTNYGVSNLGTGTLNAENNWWGTAVKTEIQALITGTVDYDPWCSDSSCGGTVESDSSIIGFTSSFTSWTVSTIRAALDWLYERSEQDTNGVNIYLHKGWNTFRLPWFVLKGTAQSPMLAGGNYDVTNVLSSIGGSYSYMAYYDGTNWQTYIPSDSAATTFTKFPTTAGDKDYTFYIYMTAADRLVIEQPK